MALATRGANPIWSEVDLTGNLFDDTFYLFVLQNTLPYIPATVYHDPQMNIPWTNPIRFLANGTLPNDIYFPPNMVFRLEFRQGNNQSDPLIYLVENYSPGSGGQTPVDTVAFASENQITNPQFSLVDFILPLTLTGVTNPPEIEIAPGWFLNLGGTGNATVTQVLLNNSNINPTNAPYALRFQLTGWNSGEVFLTQRFQQNGMLWANKFVSTSVTAQVGSTIAPVSISATLDDSHGTQLAQILDPLESIVNNEWNEFLGVSPLPATTNPDLPPAAYIEYNLALPNNTDIYITSIQVIVQDLGVETGYSQDSINRQIDHTFNYYKNPLLAKPINSYLVGWDFPTNPSQFLGDNIPSQATPANGAYYTWDQTILFQTAPNGAVIARGANGGLNLVCATASQFAFIQYLKYADNTNLNVKDLCSNIHAASNTPTTKVTISLWYTTNATLPNPPITTNAQSFINTIDANGKPSSVISGWVEIVNSRRSTAFNLTSAPNDYSIAGWSKGQMPSNTTFFAICVGTSAMIPSQNLEFQSISLQPGSVPTIPAPLSSDEVLRQCQYYYEKSYAVSTAIGTVTDVNSLCAIQLARIRSLTVADLVQSAFNFQYKTVKIAPTPTVTFYSTITANTPDSVTDFMITANSGLDVKVSADSAFDPYWISNSVGSDNVAYIPANMDLTPYTHDFGFAVNVLTTWINFHYTIDARLGVV